VQDVLHSPGAPLDAASGAFFEPRFGHDFSKVRLYANPKATNLAQTENTLAPGAAQNELSAGDGRQAIRAATGTDGGQPPGPGTPPATPTGGPDAGTTPQRHACVVKEQLPQNQPTVTLAPGLVFSTFIVDITWKPKSEDGCDPACGEYRQYVKGHILADGQPIKSAYKCCDGATLQESVYQEDSTPSGKCYGHRDRPGFPTDVFDSPDRATGTHYQGFDQPQVSGPDGTVVDWDLTFKVQSYDKCLDRFGPINEFPLKYKGKL
jgi:hypothetical protein